MGLPDCGGFGDGLGHTLDHLCDPGFGSDGFAGEEGEHACQCATDGGGGGRPDQGRQAKQPGPARAGGQRILKTVAALSVTPPLLYAWTDTVCLPRVSLLATSDNLFDALRRLPSR